MYEYWLASVRSLSSHRKRKLRAFAGSGEGVYKIEETKLRLLEFLGEKDVETIKNARKEKDLKAEYGELGRKGIRFIPWFHPDYPGKLAELPDPPYALYVKGGLPDGSRPSAAIVGARRCTHYGEAMAMEYGEVLARAGVQVISGMARGIDGAGQRGALNGGGRSYGVLGCGVDICYPRENAGLYKELQSAGGLLSEQPPEEPPLPAYFPLRNRIIRGLADVVLVMEAKERSGSLITADAALEQGRDVYALPGPATSPLSCGCHRLIRQGAGILLSPQDLLEEMGVCAGKKWEDLLKNPAKNKKELETMEKLVYSCLGFSPKSVHALLGETNLPPERLMEALITLEIEGHIKEVSKNHYIVIR